MCVCVWKKKKNYNNEKKKKKKKKKKMQKKNKRKKERNLHILITMPERRCATTFILKSLPPDVQVRLAAGLTQVRQPGR